MDHHETTTDHILPSNQESEALEAILGSSLLSIPEFFATVYQEACAVFCARPDESPPIRQHDNPYDSLIQHGWDVLIQLLEASRREQEEQASRADHDNHDDDDESAQHAPLPHEALLFRNQASLGPNTCSQTYHYSLFAAYLDGCSVVMNHADILSPHLAHLCNDLQQSFPHAYCNTYLTPPNTQSVPAHADDRDVLIIQILGQKEWTVYQRIPIPYPYPHEQVGKHGVPVPDAVLQGPTLLQRVLRRGDVLYMPRGFVHCAKALAGEFSFHVTIALATHDWSLASLVASATQQLLHQIVDYRKAVDRTLGTRDWNQVSDASKRQLQATLDDVWSRLRQDITVESLHDALQRKYGEHNERARSQREMLMTQLPMVPPIASSCRTVVGREAADQVRLDTCIRAATDMEKASVTLSSRPRGLQVSNECFDALMSVVTRVKQNPSLVCQVDQLKTLCQDESTNNSMEYLCELTWLAFARQCVELGAFAVVDGDGRL